MKVKILTAIIFLTSYLSGFCQSDAPVIDTNAIHNWTIVENGFLTADGKYFAYQLGNQPTGSKTLYLKAVNGTWERSFPGSGLTDNPFAGKDRYAILRQEPGNLKILKLGTDQIETVNDVRNFNSVNHSGREKLIYLQNIAGKESLVIRDLAKKETTILPDILSYRVSPGKSALLYNSASIGAQVTINWLDLKTGRRYKIWTGLKPDNFIFSKDESTLAFTTQKENTGKQIIYYSNGQIKTIEMHALLPIGTQFASLQSIGQDKSLLYIRFRYVNPVKPPAKGSPLEIWSFQDEQIMQGNINRGKSQTAVINVKNSNLKLIDGLTSKRIGNSDRWLISNSSFVKTEENWNNALQDKEYIFDVATGQKTPFPFTDPFYYRFSNDGRFLIYYDRPGNKYYSYDYDQGKKVDLTTGVDTEWELINDKERPIDNGYTSTYRAFSSIFLNFAWQRDGQSFILSDRWGDFWELDVTGKKAPKPLTNIFFKKTGCQPHFLWGYLKNGQYAPGQEVILDVKDEQTFKSYYYSWNIGNSNRPRLLSGYVGSQDVKIVGSDQAKYYLIKAQSPAEAPNFFYSNDLVRFRQLTFNAPQKKYNWLTADLLTWKGYNGGICHGTLFKPENFDASKKYPVIIHYYEYNGGAYNGFPNPGLMDSQIDIACFVSRGYLVYEIDYEYKYGYVGDSAIEGINKAADELVKLPFVDSTKLGLNGHSFGGCMTNYIVTHSKRFAAACSASGIADNISAYNSIFFNRVPMQTIFETNQVRMGIGFWERPDLYLRTSPILCADKVNTPMLLMANKQDTQVPYEQGLAFYLSLRRLGKPAWLLDYEGEGHVLHKEANMIDFATRMEQFFDFYLKGKPAPIWMLQDLDFNHRGNKAGLALDDQNRKPGLGLLTDDEKQRLDNYSRIPLFEKLKRINEQPKN